MITEIDIDPFEMKEFDLTNVGIEGKLIFEENQTYIEAEGDIFPIYSVGSFSQSGDGYILSNGDEEDYSCINLTKEQFEIIKDILTN